MFPSEVQPWEGVSQMKGGFWEKEYAETKEHLVCLETEIAVRRLDLKKWFQSWLHSRITREEFFDNYWWETSSQTN